MFGEKELSRQEKRFGFACHRGGLEAAFSLRPTVDRGASRCGSRVSLAGVRRREEIHDPDSLEKE
jgi:hypothetical protein